MKKPSISRPDEVLAKNTLLVSGRSLEIRVPLTSQITGDVDGVDKESQAHQDDGREQPVPEETTGRGVSDFALEWLNRLVRFIEIPEVFVNPSTGSLGRLLARGLKKREG